LLYEDIYEVMSDTGDCISTDEYYEALANRFRREVLCVVHDHEGDCLTEDQFVDHIERLYDAPETDIRTALTHVHLPKLADVGFVEYDRRSGTLRASDSAFLSEKLDADVVECKYCSRDDVRIEP
jgi:DNA-binding transcriptional ArsR family regulator